MNDALTTAAVFLGITEMSAIISYAVCKSTSSYFTGLHITFIQENLKMLPAKRNTMFAQQFVA